MWPKRLLRTSALLGALACALGGAVSEARMLGRTPVPLILNTAPLTTLRQFASIPIEFFGLVWFVAVILLYRRDDPGPSSLRSLFATVSASIAAGAGAWIIHREPWCWPLVAATAAAAAIMVAASTDGTEWPAAAMTSMKTRLAALARSPRSRAAAATFLAVSTLCAVTIHALSLNVARQDAVSADLRRWYRSQAPALPPDLAGTMTRPSGARVVVFTDYAWTPRRNNVAEQAGIAQAFAHKGLPIDFVVRVFPHERHCADPTPPNAEDSPSCEAAYAVKLVAAERGEPEARALAAWLYSRATVLSSKLIDSHLQELGLLGELNVRRAELHKRLLADIALGQRLAVRTTPTYFVNGIRIPDVPGGPMRMLQFEMERWEAAQTGRH